MSPTNSVPRNAMLLVNALSVSVPLVVALLLAIPSKFDLGRWTQYLPHWIAAINTTTALLLIIGFVAQRSGNILIHRRSMTAAFTLGAVFLVCYVIYHLTNPSTKFGGQGMIKFVYYGVLLSHILLSILVLPLVLRTFLFALTNQFERHRSIARFAFPIWLYVSITGVIAYAMISPYYGK